VFHVLR
jgi:hypothetical protein